MSTREFAFGSCFSKQFFRVLKNSRVLVQFNNALDLFFIPFMKSSTPRDRNILDKKIRATFNVREDQFLLKLQTMAPWKILSDFASNNRLRAYVEI